MAFYHAGVSPARKKEIVELWLAGQLEVVAATIAFAMGLDRSDVRLVILYGSPASVGQYAQQVHVCTLCWQLRVDVCLLYLLTQTLLAAEWTGGAGRGTCPLHLALG